MFDIFCRERATRRKIEEEKKTHSSHATFNGKYNARNLIIERLIRADALPCPEKASFKQKIDGFVFAMRFAAS